VKCILSGEETKVKTLNYPMKREFIQQIADVRDAYQAEVELKVENDIRENNDLTKDMDEDKIQQIIKLMTPTVSRREVLRLAKARYPRILEMFGIEVPKVTEENVVDVAKEAVAEMKENDNASEDQ
jgi:hypothetical protein